MARGKLGKAAKKFSKEVLEEAAERTRKADIADAVNDAITAKTGASIHKPTMSEHAEAAKGLLTAEEVSAQAKLNAPEMRRKRRLEIENNPNASPEARAKASAQLDAKKSKPETAAEYKQREADRVNNSEAGKNYREKQAEIQAQNDAQHKSEMSQMKKDARDRIQSNREARQRTRDERIDRQADAQLKKSQEADRKAEMQNKYEEYKKKKAEQIPTYRSEGDRQSSPLSAYERQQRGLSGQSKDQYNESLKQKAEKEAADEAEKARKKAQSETDKAKNEAQKRIDRQNEPLIRRTLDNLSDKGKEVVSNVSDFFSGKTRQENAAFATAYNDMLRKNNSADFIDIKGAGNLRAKYDGKDVQEIFEAEQEAAEKSAKVAKEHAEWWANKKDGISDFIKENSIVTAAGIAGTAIIGASLLDND